MPLAFMQEDFLLVYLLSDQTEGIVLKWVQKLLPCEIVFILPPRLLDVNKPNKAVKLVQ